MKIKEYKSGAYACFEKTGSNAAPYIVKVYDPRGNLHDKMRCDDYRDAMDYFRAFCGIAKNNF